MQRVRVGARGEASQCVVTWAHCVRLDYWSRHRHDNLMESQHSLKLLTFLIFTLFKRAVKYFCFGVIGSHSVVLPQAAVCSVGCVDRGGVSRVCVLVRLSCISWLWQWISSVCVMFGCCRASILSASFACCVSEVLCLLVYKLFNFNTCHNISGSKFVYCVFYKVYTCW